VTEFLTPFGMAREALGFLLLVTGILKTATLPAFRMSLGKLAIVPPRMTPAVALIVPVVEVTLGALNVANRQGVRGAQATAGLFALFALVVFIVIRRSPEPAECRCLGGRAVLSDAVVVRNLGLSVLAVASTLRPSYALLSAGGVLFLIGILWRPALHGASPADSTRRSDGSPHA